MLKLILFIQLLLAHYATQTMPEIQSNCNEDVSLECPVSEKNPDFLSVAWYKNNNGMKHGIIRRHNGEDPVYYNFSRVVRFGERHNLVLERVSPADSGIYQCTISANVGGQNQNHEVNLTVHECVTLPEPTTMKNVLNTTVTSPLCQTQVQDLPVIWGIAGYVTVALAKIALSLISIWVIHVRSSREQDNRWYY